MFNFESILQKLRAQVHYATHLHEVKLLRLEHSHGSSLDLQVVLAPAQRLARIAELTFEATLNTKLFFGIKKGEFKGIFKSLFCEIHGTVSIFSLTLNERRKIVLSPVPRRRWSPRARGS